MTKISQLLASLLFASVSVAYAADVSNQTTNPAAQGATSVQTQLDSGASKKSSGHADKGLTTAETNITKKHDSADKEKAEKPTKAEHPSMPDHSAMPDRPTLPDRPERPAGR